MTTCDSCAFKKHYTTRQDEYPANTKLFYCSKMHWADGDTPTNEEKSFFQNCPDYTDKLKPETK